MSSICEEKNYTRIHNQHAKRLRNFLYYRYGSLEKARDYAQEAFIKLWENCKDIPFEKAANFLFTAANHQFLDYLDHQKTILKFNIRNRASEAQTETSPEFIVREKEFKERLESSISKLPENQRTVFLLSRIDKMKNREIAEDLNISIKTVEKNVALALKSLKEKIDEIKDVKI